jgi:hypothetical protein
MTMSARPAIVKAQRAPFRPHSEHSGALHRDKRIRPPRRLQRLPRLSETAAHFLGHQMEIDFLADSIANFLSPA